MLSTIQMITEGEYKKCDWGLSGLEFEDMIFDRIAYELQSAFSQGAKLERTPNTRDGGVDLIITSTCPVSVMGQNFSMRGKKRITIYIECKYTTQKILPLEKFSKNLLIAARKKTDYFLLVTNASISPYSFYEAANTFSSEVNMFRLVDQDTLLRCLNASDPRIHNIPKKIPALFVAYQTEKKYVNGHLGLDVYIQFKSNTPDATSCDLQLISDRNWLLEKNNIHIILDSNATVCKKITVERINHDGVNDILLQFILDGERRTVQIVGTSTQYNFVLPFCGEAHRSLLSEIIHNTTQNDHIHLMCLTGEAGIGKSRIMDEACNTLILQGNTCFRFTFTHETSLTDLCNNVRKQMKLPASTDASFLQIVSELSTKPLKRYFLVIEDIHNAPEQFFNELRMINQCSCSHSPVYLAVAGRDDNTVCNEPYYTFLEWCKCMKESSICSFRKVPALEKEECINLIKSIINEAPSFVINKIQVFSQGNPFFLIQYIEYLLETKIIHLVNRTTVGITNAVTFCNNLYIPAGVEDIIGRRFSILQTKQSENTINFLNILAYMGGAVSTQFFNYYFGDDSAETLSMLFENHLLKQTDQGVSFDHESIFLFVRERIKKKTCKENCCKNLYSKPMLMMLIPSLKVGEIQLYAGDIKAAKEHFHPLIMELEGASNISSINLTPQYYEYYFSVYEFANKLDSPQLDKHALLGIVYTAMHNLSSGNVDMAFHFVNKQLNSRHQNDQQLKTTIKVLYAHYYLSVGKTSKAKQYINELLALERYSPELFDDQTRFNLFDRASSLFLQENHIEPAQKYNRLAWNIAVHCKDYKLMTLAKIIEAKICFYTNTHEALNTIKAAEELAGIELATRIACHNKIGKLTAEILIAGASKETGIKYMPQAIILLEESLQVGYPLAIIRTHYLLAVLHYLVEEIALAKQHLENGIEISIKIGNMKLLPQYYNLKLIIASTENQPIEILSRYAETAIEYMRQQDMLFLGALDFGSVNIINVTNHAIFLKEYLPETESYKFMRTIEFYGANGTCDYECSSHKECRYSCNMSREVYLENYQRIQYGQMLFMNEHSTYHFRDIHSPFYIPLGV